MTNIDRVLKNRDITLLTNFCTVKAMVFPVVMDSHPVVMDVSWTIKKAEHQELMLLTAVLKKTLESPLDCKEIKLVNFKGNQP